MISSSRSATLRLACLFAAAWTTGVVLPVAQAQVADPAVVGSWTVTQPTPYMAIHAHMLPTGKVMYWDSYEHADHAQLWDPLTGVSTDAAVAGYNIFCTGFSFLPDGQLLVTGGHIADFVGLAKASLYNPFTNVWKELPSMAGARWYPTNTALPDGNALVVSGQIDQAVGMNSLPEVFEAATGTWRKPTNAQLVQPFYPYMFVAPNGKVFAAGPNATSRYLDTAGAGAWTAVADYTFGTRTWGSAAMYGDGKVIVSGGTGCAPYNYGCASIPTNTAEVIDLNASVPAWSTSAPMAYARKHHNMTILPDGKIFVSGGSTGPEPESQPPQAVLPTEIWDPGTGQWTTTSSLPTRRSYHSVALLLPDGRVFTGGGLDKSYELYSPPYLFKGPRPRFSSSGELPPVVRGQTAFVGTPDYASISKVTMLSLGTVTHAFNAGQRINVLPFSVGANGINVAFPSDANLSPPGYYMLFLLNSAGVPSVAKMVRVDAPSTSTPVAPSGLSAAVVTTGKQKRVNLRWVDNASNEAGFRIERSTDGVTFTVIASVGANVTTFTDGGAKNKASFYYYRVQAYNAAGNSVYSNVVSLGV